MSQRGSHSHEDSRPDRRQDPDMGVQGRFGRQEDWRKVERQQASRKLTLREQVELEAAEQRRMSREAAERREAEMQRRRQMARQQAAEERLRRQQQQQQREGRYRSEQEQPEQSIQGRFGAPGDQAEARARCAAAGCPAGAPIRPPALRVARTATNVAATTAGAAIPAASAGAAIHGGAGSSPFPAARPTDPDAG